MTKALKTALNKASHIRAQVHPNFHTAKTSKHCIKRPLSREEITTANLGHVVAACR